MIVFISVLFVARCLTLGEYFPFQDPSGLAVSLVKTFIYRPFAQASHFLCTCNLIRLNSFGNENFASRPIPSGKAPKLCIWELSMLRTRASETCFQKSKHPVAWDKYQKAPKPKSHCLLRRKPFSKNKINKTPKCQR